MKRTIFLILAILVLVILGYQVFDAYLLNHPYYFGSATDVGMLGSAQNRKVLIRALLAACIPVSYLLFMKKKSLKGLAISAFLGLFLYSVAEAVIKQDILGPGFLLMLFKYVIIVGIIVYFIVGLLAVGTRLRKKTFGSHHWNIEQIFLNIGLGLIVFCLLNYALIILHLFYGIVVAVMFVGLGVVWWMMRKSITEAGESVAGIVNEISRTKAVSSPTVMMFVILALFSFMYLFYGFVLSDIPYPTAWDANHAYMYFPKIWALNAGFYWEESIMTTPTMWLGYIAYWFKFMFIFGQNTWISADNLAVIMNFLSGVFTLTFGLILVKEVLIFIHGKEERKTHSLFFAIGWFLLILWLTSGMGAFLVFVDNKTDLGVMALTILALYSGFFFLNQLRDHTEGKKHSLHYVILSGVFFAGAILAKPTATFDVINFTVMIAALWFGAILAFGGFLLLLGVLGKSAILTVQKFLNDTMSNQLLAAGGIVGVAGVVYAWLRKKWANLRYLLVWGVVIIATLVVVKAPYLVTKQLKVDDNFAPVKLIKDIFLTRNDTEIVDKKKDRILLASTYDYRTLLAADAGADQTDSSEITQPNDVIAACEAQNISKEDLYSNLKTPPGSALNEDVGRYIGYGWRTFDRPWRGFAFSEGCHAWTADAKILCQNEDVIQNPTLSGLQSLYEKLPDNTRGKEILGSIMDENTTAIQLAADIRELEAYYKDKSWYKEDGKISLPFTALVPFNITFNWSLQNLTSYYTDIGVIWLLCLFLIIIGFIYSLVKWNKSLFAVTLATLTGWTLWWVAGGAILWYSLGVVIWTVIATTLVLYTLGNDTKGVQKNLFMLLAAVFAFIGLFQLLLNFIRISSQGGGGPFVWYRANVGNVTTFDSNLVQETKQKIGYSDEDVFQLQFGHYDKTISILDARDDNEGVVIAGTYLPYFLTKQTGISNDGFLVDLWKNLSDNDPCRTYLRLKDMQEKYLVIDPNIASVVMGDANRSLMDRIFGKLDESGDSLIDYGSITMIVQMVEEGYMSLAATNIISAKYAFELSSEELRAAFPGFSEDDVVLRAKLTTLRFWPKANQMFARLPAIFTQRMTSMEAIDDIASMMGKNVDTSKLQGLARSFLSKQNITPDTFAELTQDEKNVLVQYLSLYNLMKTNSQQYQQYMMNLLQQSVLGSSQVMLFERK